MSLYTCTLCTAISKRCSQEFGLVKRVASGIWGSRLLKSMPVDGRCTDLRNACLYRCSEGNLVEESIQVGKEVGTSSTFATLRASIVTGGLDEAVTVEISVL